MPSEHNWLPKTKRESSHGIVLGSIRRKPSPRGQVSSRSPGEAEREGGNRISVRWLARNSVPPSNSPGVVRQSRGAAAANRTTENKKLRTNRRKREEATERAGSTRSIPAGSTPPARETTCSVRPRGSVAPRLFLHSLRRNPPASRQEFSWRVNRLTGLCALHMKRA
jgi:hypothetical protein